MSVKKPFEDTPQITEMKSGHPINYLLRRELYGTGSPRNKIIDWRLDKSYNLYRKNLSSHFGCVNAIEFSKDGTQLASGGDDRRILLWNVEKVLSGNDTPVIMQAEHLSNIFCLSFDNCNTKIFSAGNDDFVIIHDIATKSMKCLKVMDEIVQKGYGYCASGCRSVQTFINAGAPLDYFMHEQPVFGIAVNPLNDNIFTSACDDGRILLFDIREPSSSDPFCLAKVNSAFHSVMFNPVEPRLITSANSKEGVSLWDIRTPKKPLMKYGGQNTDQCSMSARFNSDGSQILALRRRLPPVLYATHSTSHLFQFNHKGYYNSCTMKSCCFAGSDDQYILSGSDNFDLFMWKIPPSDSNRWVDKAHMVLKGHRSIVNQVRYNKIHPLIASSGVEKLVKLWSPFPIASKPGASGLSTITYEKERQIYTHDEYINLIMQSGQFMSLTFDTTAGKNTKEDPRMMAFFDALVQRDINGLSEESEDCSRGTSYTNLIFRPFNSASSSEVTDDDDDSQVNSSQSPGQANSLNSSAAADNQNLDADSDNGFESSQNNDGTEPTRSLRDGRNTIRAAWILNAVVREQNQLVNSRNRNRFSDSSESERETNNSCTSQKLSNRNDREETKNINSKSSKISDENMLTKLIVQRENHLRRLARFHVLLESKAKSRKKAASCIRYSSSESLSSTAVDRKSKDSKKYFPTKSTNRDNLHSSRSDESVSDSSNCDNNNSSMGKSKYFYRRKYSSSPPPKKSKPKPKKRSLSKTLLYSDYKTVGEKSSACNYWKTKSAICNSSTFDVHKPNANSKTVGGDSSTVLSDSTSSSPSGTSSESDSSDSEKTKNKSGTKKRKLETSKKKVAKESNSSSSESSSSDSSSTSSSTSDSDNDGGKYPKKSLALKFSPLLRRLKMEQIRRRQKNKSARKKVVDLKQGSSDSTEVSASSQSQSNKSSDEELLMKKKKLSSRKKETKNSKGKVASNMKTLTNNAVVTTDSGIEIEKTGLQDEPQPCCSKSLGNTSKATPRNEKAENQCETNSSEDNANTVAFRKRVPNRKRHYRRTKNSSD